MQKTLLLIALKLLLFVNSFAIIIGSPALRQTRYRWRNDDGNEAAATWKAALNTSITVTDISEPLRLRLEFDNDNGWGEDADINQTLYYTKDGGGTWTAISASAANDFVFVSSSLVTHGDATTNQFGAPTPGVFEPGKIVSQVTPAVGFSIADGGKTEVEWVIQPTPHLTAFATYQFRVNGLDGTPNTYAVLNTNCIATIVETVPDTLCSPGVMVLSATGSPGATVKWYDSPTGGTLLATGSTYTTPTLSSTTTYYVMAETTGCSSDRVPVNANVFYTPITTVPDTICGEGTLNLTGASTDGAVINWYDDAALTTLLFTGDVFTTPVLSSTTTYYAVAAIGACNSLPDAVTALVYDLPVISVTPAIDTVCLGDTAAFQATVDPDYTYLWDPSGETNSLIHTPVLGTHTVSVTDEHGCSNSASAVLQVFDPISVEGFDYIPDIFSDPLTYRFFPIDPVAVTGYLWDFGDGTTSTDPSPTHTYPAFGNYDVRLTVLNDCESDSIMLNINVEEENATTDLQLSASLDVYPLPASTILHMELTNGDKIQRVSLINQLGQVVRLEEFSQASSQDLSVAELPVGTYFLLIETSEGGRAGKKLVIQR